MDGHGPPTGQRSHQEAPAVAEAGGGLSARVVERLKDQPKAIDTSIFTLMLGEKYLVDNFPFTVNFQ